MKKSTRQKLSMYKAVFEVCKTHETDWAGIAGFVEAVNNLETAISTLDSKAQLQASKTVGVMANRIDKIEAVIELMLILHGVLEMHGKEIGDVELRIRNKKTVTSLKRMDNTRLNVQFNLIIEDLALFGNALTPYGITPDFVTESLVLIEAARISLSRPRMAIIERKGYTNSLDVQTAEIDEIIKLRLDKMMRLFKNSLPDFFELYSNARLIVDLGSRHTSSEPPTIPSPDEPDDGV